MQRADSATQAMAAEYWSLFVNRLAHTVQSQKPGDDGKHYYYRPRGGHRLSLETIQQHLKGQLTIALYASLLLLKETLDGSSTELETQTTPKIPLTRVNPRETTKKTLR